MDFCLRLTWETMRHLGFLRQLLLPRGANCNTASSNDRYYHHRIVPITVPEYNDIANSSEVPSPHSGLSQSGNIIFDT